MFRLLVVPALALTALTLVPTDAEACAMALPPSMKVADIGNVFDAIDAEADVEEVALAQAKGNEEKNNFVREPIEMPSPPIVEATVSVKPVEAEPTTIPEVAAQAKTVARVDVPKS